MSFVLDYHTIDNVLRPNENSFFVCEAKSQHLIEDSKKEGVLKEMMRYLIALISEICAVIRSSAVYCFHRMNPDKPKGGTNKINILCVHGHLHNDSGFRAMRKKLKKVSGVNTVNVVNYKSLTKDIVQNSKMIRKRLEQIRQEQKDFTGFDVLIGHSQGGIEALEYALEHSPKEKKCFVITMGSPVNGTTIADKIGFSPSARQMRSNSEYLIGLNERIKEAKHIQVFQLASDFDLITKTSPSKFLKCSLEERERIETLHMEYIGHLTFLYSNQVFNEIRKYIEKINLEHFENV